MVWNDFATALLLVPGGVLALTGSLGVVRMPDFYTRLHPAGKSDTLAQALILLGLSFQAADWNVAVKLLMLTALLFVTAPTATHAITKAAQLDHLEPWRSNSTQAGTDAATVGNPHAPKSDLTSGESAPPDGELPRA